MSTQDRLDDDADVQGLADHACCYSAGGNYDAWNVANQITGQQDQAICQEPDDRSYPDCLGVAKTDQHSLIKTPVGDCPRPRRHDH